MLIILAISVILAYCRGIGTARRAEAKPNCLSWIIWSCVDVMLLATSLHTGSLSTLVLLVIYTIGAVVLAFVSRSNISKLEGLEIGAIAISTLSIIGWTSTGSPQASLILSIAAHACGTILTIKNVVRLPRNEDRRMWLLFLIGNIANLVAISYVGWSTWLFPIYETLSCLCIWALTFRQRNN